MFLLVLFKGFWYTKFSKDYVIHSFCVALRKA